MAVVEVDSSREVLQGSKASDLKAEEEQDILDNQITYDNENMVKRVLLKTKTYTLLNIDTCKAKHIPWLSSKRAEKYQFACTARN